MSRLLQSASRLSAPDFQVLVQLTGVPDGRQRLLDLAHALEWEKSRMSHHIVRMAKRGLVDGRRSKRPLHVEAVRSLFLGHVTTAELATLARISERVVERLDQEPF